MLAVNYLNSILGNSPAKSLSTMDLKLKQQSESAPLYQTFETYCELDDDIPGPRCSHTLTTVPATGSDGPRLILFGGATAIEGGSSSTPGISSDSSLWLSVLLCQLD